MSVLVAVPIVLPLAAAAVVLMLHGRLAWQRALTVAAVGASTAAVLWLLARVGAAGTAVAHLGGWPPGVGITLVADLFSLLVLAISSVTVLCVLLFAVGQMGDALESAYFHPLYLVLTAGVGASFLTGDLFNLFVAFEVTLIASYVLLTLSAGRDAIRPAMTYVVVNLLASVLFLTAVALVYAATGTVNLADLVGRIAALPDGTRAALRLLLLLVFGIKAAMFPLFFWLPDSYPTAPTAITAVFAGLLTKVGVYAIIRTQTVLFGPVEGPDTLVLTLAGATMLTGVLGAIVQDDISRILSFHIVSQIGYMVFGLGLFTAAGVAAAILYVVHHIGVKASLFLVAGLVESTTGTSDLQKGGGLARRQPVTAALFALPALSLAGLPPFSGFFGKLALVQAGLESARYVVVAVSLLVSLLTLFSMTKIWSAVFWGDPPPRPGQARAGSTPGVMTAATAALVAVTVLVAAGAGPLHRFAQRAAAELVDPSTYVEAVYGQAREESE